MTRAGILALVAAGGVVSACAAQQPVTTYDSGAYAVGEIDSYQPSDSFYPATRDVYHAEPGNDLYESDWYDRNPFGVGEDWFDDKWDTGGWDMGEYDAAEYPLAYATDEANWDTGPWDIGRYQTGASEEFEGWYDDGYDSFWYDEDDEYDEYVDSNPYGVGSDIVDDHWDTGFFDMGEVDWDEYHNAVGTYDWYRARGVDDDGVWGYYGSPDETEFGENPAIVYDSYVDVNPYGVGYDRIDDKWDMGVWDMGEFDAADWPEQYREDTGRSWYTADWDDAAQDYGWFGW